MKCDVLVAEIGSTTTKVHAFDRLVTADPVWLGQGIAPTSIDDGDVTIGLKAAIHDLKQQLGVESMEWDELFATSSAAGGLRMTVHGLVYDMTVRAAREAALGAGAIIQLVTAGKLTQTDLSEVAAIQPRLILVSGGVDYGERETALHNFDRLTDMCPGVPLIYAGNVQNVPEIRLIASRKGARVYCVDNVYPSIDRLRIEPARRIIQEAFEAHIVEAPGMQSIRELVSGPILPTPGAVMTCAMLLYDLIGDLIVFDVGGATTDLHAVTDGSAEISRMLVSPEPFAKRTVEGDLGVYVNRRHVVDQIGMANLEREMPGAEVLLPTIGPIPQTAEEIRLIERLTLEAVRVALDRHAGRLTDLYGPTGRKTIASGKDLTAVRSVIGTGGALCRLPAGRDILRQALAIRKGNRLLPPEDTTVWIDETYTMAAIGVLSMKYREAAVRLLRQQFPA